MNDMQATVGVSDGMALLGAWSRTVWTSPTGSQNFPGIVAIPLGPTVSTVKFLGWGEDVWTMNRTG